MDNLITKLLFFLNKKISTIQHKKVFVNAEFFLKNVCTISRKCTWIVFVNFLVTFLVQLFENACCSCMPSHFTIRMCFVKWLLGGFCKDLELTWRGSVTNRVSEGVWHGKGGGDGSLLTIFTEMARRPIQSISCDVNASVSCANDWDLEPHGLETSGQRAYP